MHLSLDTRVGEAERSFHARRSFFEILGIDACCSGDHTLREAAKTAGGRPTSSRAADRWGREFLRVSGSRDWNEAELPALDAAHIVEHHHRGARRLLVELARACGR